jgi:hypothetical protein
MSSMDFDTSYEINGHASDMESNEVKGNKLYSTM